MFTSCCKTPACQTRSSASGTALPQAVLSPLRRLALNFSNVGGCSLAPLLKASQAKELAFQTGPVIAVHSVAGATKGAEHP